MLCELHLNLKHYKNKKAFSTVFSSFPPLRMILRIRLLPALFLITFLVKFCHKYGVRKLTMPLSLSQTSRLQSWKTISFCCFKLLSLWCFLYGSPGKLIWWPMHAVSKRNDSWDIIRPGQTDQHVGIAHSQPWFSTNSVRHYHWHVRNPLGHWIKWFKWSNDSSVLKENPFINKHENDHRVKKKFKWW